MQALGKGIGQRGIHRPVHLDQALARKGDIYSLCRVDNERNKNRCAQ